MYILDKDPYNSAIYLTRLHISTYIRKLEQSFIYFNDKNYSTNEKTIIKSIIHSKENYDWFSKFYESLIEAYKSIKEYTCENNNFKKEYLYTNNILFESTGLNLPCILDFDYLKYKTQPNKKYINRVQDTISKNRILYILNDYKADSFPMGMPAWYSKIGEEVYSCFSRVDRKNVKILAVDGNYKYYISTISDKWEEIKNVPPEIKYFINSLLYNSSL